MSEFFTGKQLNNCLLSIIKEAKSELTIIPPYVKLHKKYRNALEEKVNENIRITFIYRAESKITPKPIELDNLEFLKRFKNIKVSKQQNLHAKFYANEFMYLISSMNLTQYSQSHNIEFGVLFYTGRKTVIPNSQARMNLTIGNEMIKIINSSKEVFTSEGYNSNTLFPNLLTYDQSLEDLKSVDSDDIGHLENEQKIGYCISTRQLIKFNIKKPMCNKEYEDWLSKKDFNAPQKFCHFSGDLSEGKTSFKKPVLNKYWESARRIKELSPF